MNVTKSIWALVVIAATTLAAPYAESAPGEVVVAISRFVVAPGQEVEFEARSLRGVEFYRKAEPDMTIHAHRSKKDAQVFVIYESWPSVAAYERHRTVVKPARLKELGPTPPGMLVKPPESDLFTRVTN